MVLFFASRFRPRHMLRCRSTQFHSAPGPIIYQYAPAPISQCAPVSPRGRSRDAGCKFLHAVFNTFPRAAFNKCRSDTTRYLTLYIIIIIPPLLILTTTIILILISHTPSNSSSSITWWRHHIMLLGILHRYRTYGIYLFAQY